MAITQIKLDTFTLDVATPALEKELQKLNTHKDTVIDVNDIQMPAGLIKPELQNELLEEAVAQAFVSSGLFTENKRDALVKFFDLYENVERLAAHVEQWKATATVITETGEHDRFIGLKPGTKSLRFASDTPSPSLTLAFDTDSFMKVANKMHTVIHWLTAGAGETRTPGVGSNSNESDKKNHGCGGYEVLVGFRYDSYHLPAELQGPVAKAVESYLKSMEWLLQFDQSYTANTESEMSELRKFDRLPELKYIKTGAKNEHATEIRYFGCDTGF
jgi:hypothetical protein